MRYDQRRSHGSLSQPEAEEVAINALGFIAADPQLLPRFLALTGIEASQVRQAAAEPGFMAGVLAFIAAHEPTLLQFCEHSAMPPERVLAAARALPGGADDFERST